MGVCPQLGPGRVAWPGSPSCFLWDKQSSRSLLPPGAVPGAGGGTHRAECVPGTWPELRPAVPMGEAQPPSHPVSAAGGNALGLSFVL